MYVSLGQTTTRIGAPPPSGSSPLRSRFVTKASTYARSTAAPSPAGITLQTSLEEHEQEQAWKAEQAAADAAAAAAAENGMYADDPYLNGGYVDDDMYQMTEQQANGQQQPAAAAANGDEPNYLLYAAIGMGALALLGMGYMVMSTSKR